jgi:hypothetical protein
MEIYHNRVKVGEYSRRHPHKHFSTLTGINHFLMPDGLIKTEAVYTPHLDIAPLGDLIFIAINTRFLKKVVILMKFWPFIRIEPFGDVVLERDMGEE